MSTERRTPPNETDLLRSLRDRDESAFEELVRFHRSRMLATARGMLKNEEDARDAVQDAFLAAFQGIARFRGGSRLATWLHRIVVNCCLMTLRRRRARPEHLLARFPDVPDTGGRLAESSLEREETADALRAGIDRLPDTQRRVFVMRAIRGLRTQDAARALDLTPNVVRIRLHRAKRALRGELAPHFGLATAG